MKNNMKIYLANALFSEADLMYNSLLFDEMIVRGHEVYAPQKNDAINDKSNFADSIMIYNGDREQLDWADCLVAVLDGPVVDPGVAAEIGYFAARGKLIIGLYTDSRDCSKGFSNTQKINALDVPLENQFSYVNLFVVGAIKENGEIFTSRDQLLEYLEFAGSETPKV
jgi:nucleoside 2-deoxyribosyltransferase